MNILETYQPILSPKSHLTSQEVMAITGWKRPKISKDLNRLVKLGKLIKIHRGKWMVHQNANRLQLPQLLSVGPTYCTAHTALSWHGMIEQIPNAIYAVTTGRPIRRSTPMGPVHVHRITPSLFLGWENQPTRIGGTNTAKIATPKPPRNHPDARIRLGHHPRLYQQDFEQSMAGLSKIQTGRTGSNLCSYKRLRFGRNVARPKNGCRKIRPEEWPPGGWTDSSDCGLREKRRVGNPSALGQGTRRKKLKGDGRLPVTLRSKRHLANNLKTGNNDHSKKWLKNPP
jgi:hypothetical protein